MLAKPPLRIISRSTKLTSEFESSSRCASYLAPAASVVTAHLGQTLEFLLTLPTRVADNVLTVCFFPMQVCILIRGAIYITSRTPQLARTFIKHVEFASHYVLDAKLFAPSQKPFSSVIMYRPSFFQYFACRNQCFLRLLGGLAPAAAPMRSLGTPVGLTRVPQ